MNGARSLRRLAIASGWRFNEPRMGRSAPVNTDEEVPFLSKRAPSNVNETAKVLQ